MNQKSRISQFLSADKIAVAGVSRNKNKFGSIVYRELLKKNINAVPVNPNMETAEGNPCFSDISVLPKDVDAVVCVVKPQETEEIVRQALAAGITKIWMQQGSESEDAVSFCLENNMSVVSNACIMMYAQPVTSIHKLHAGIAKLFGKYDK